MTAQQLAQATKDYDTPNLHPEPIRVHPKIAAAERRIRSKTRTRKKSA
jgi:hypothetical protein